MSGLEAIRTDYTLPVNTLDSKSIKVQGVQIVTVKRRSIYIVTISLGSANAALTNQLIQTITVQ